MEKSGQEEDRQCRIVELFYVCGVGTLATASMGLKTCTIFLSVLFILVGMVLQQ